jgi:hypothetical protein
MFLILFLTPACVAFFSRWENSVKFAARIEATLRMADTFDSNRLNSAESSLTSASFFWLLLMDLSSFFLASRRENGQFQNQRDTDEHGRARNKFALCASSLFHSSCIIGLQSLN